MTKEIKHTPLPWTWDENHPETIRPKSHKQPIFVDCGSRPVNARYKADMQLIAAAPDLLEALECLKSEIIALKYDCVIDLDDAQAAIAKAKGDKQ